jgi:predicted alpha/beta-hydrolase family hydrolase
MAAVACSELSIEVGERVGRVSGLLMRPPAARWLYVLAHGAGAGMRHRFMEAVAGALAERDVATLRYQFPYTEAGGRRPDPPGVLQATVRAAVAAASGAAPELPLVAGGKSLGGRMTSSAAARSPLPGVRGLAFLGFPLHAPNRPGIERSEHLDGVQVPMLFLQGTRDALADLDLMRAVCARIGRRATLHVVEGGDHSFGVLKRSGRTEDEVIAELGDTIVSWAADEGLQ